MKRGKRKTALGSFGMRRGTLHITDEGITLEDTGDDAAIPFDVVRSFLSARRMVPDCVGE